MLEMMVQCRYYVKQSTKHTLGHWRSKLTGEYSKEIEKSWSSMGFILSSSDIVKKISLRFTPIKWAVGRMTSLTTVLEPIAAQTNTETTSPQAFVITERNKQTDNGLQLILAICIPVIIVISLLVVIIAVKRLRNKTSKDKESEEVIYVNESSSVPLDRKYEGFQIDDQYSETLPNEENPYSNASDTEEQGEPADMSQTVMEYNEEYDHLAFDGTKKNVGQKSSVDSETDNSYGTLHGNRVGEDQQDVYDLAESSHTKTLDITGAEYATSSKVRGIRDGGDEYSTPNKVREIKNVSAEYSTPEKVRGISNGGFVRDNDDNTRLYSTDDVTDNTYDHAT